MKKRIKNLIFYAVLLLIGFLINLPIINMAGSAFKSDKEIFTNNNILPHHPTIANFSKVLSTTPYFRYVLNSLMVAVAVAVVVAIVSSLAGYALARYTNKIMFFRHYSKLFLLLQMFPGVLLMVPIVVLLSSVGLGDSLWGLILVYISTNIPFCTWMISGFFEEIPSELDEAAKIDGCNMFQSFIKIVIPLSKSGIASIMIFTFINCWNEYMMANVILKSQDLRTLPLGLQTFIMQFDTDWSSLMAASTMTIIPVMLFLIFMQKHIVSGLTAGAVKG